LRRAGREIVRGGQQHQRIMRHRGTGYGVHAAYVLDVRFLTMNPSATA
jgi:hypothetical protein